MEKKFNIFYIFAFGSGQPEGFTYEPETEPIQFGFRKMNPTLPEMLIQPNPTLIVRVGLVRVVGLNSKGWVGPGCRVAGLNVHPYH